MKEQVITAFKKKLLQIQKCDEIDIEHITMYYKLDDCDTYPDKMIIKFCNFKLDYNLNITKFDNILYYKSIAIKLTYYEGSILYKLILDHIKKLETKTIEDYNREDYDEILQILKN